MRCCPHQLETRPLVLTCPAITSCVHRRRVIANLETLACSFADSRDVREPEAMLPLAGGAVVVAVVEAAAAHRFALDAPIPARCPSTSIRVPRLCRCAQFDAAVSGVKLDGVVEPGC